MPVKWKFWKRNTSDPLARLMLDKYSLNLLPVPREDVAVGDLYIYDGKRNFPPSSIKNFIETNGAPFEFPPIREGETMAGIAGTVSDTLDVNIGLEFAEEFLSAISGGIPVQLRAHYSSQNVKKVRFRFPDMRRDWLDVLLLNERLVGQKMKEQHRNSFYGKGYRYFVATAVARSQSISIIAEDQNMKALDMDIDPSLMKISPKLAVYSSRKGEVTFQGKKKLGFAIEVVELKYDEQKNEFSIGLVYDTIKFRKTKPAPVLIGDAESGSMFINVDQ